MKVCRFGVDGLAVLMALLAPSPVLAQIYDDPTCDPSECLVEGRLYEPNEEGVSPSILAEPIYGCASVVGVHGFTAGAIIAVEVMGFGVVGSTSPLPGEQTVIVEIASGLGRTLQIGDQVRALQFGPFGTTMSNWVLVRDHTLDYPAGIPAPRVWPLPVRGCGRAVGAVDLVPGATVTFYEGFNELRKLDVPWAWWRQGFRAPTTFEGESITVTQELCGMPASSGPQAVLAPPPEPLAMPILAGSGAIYDFEQESVVLGGLFFGSHVVFEVNGIDAIDHPSLSAYGETRNFRLPAFSATDIVEVRQDFCEPGSGERFEIPVVAECDALPAAQMQPPSVGDTQIILDTSIPGSTIRVFAGPAPGEQIGERTGSGNTIALLRPLAAGETVAVAQTVGRCTSQWAHTLTVRCKGIRRHRNPLGVGAYEVGGFDYELPGGPVDLGGGVMSDVRARVRYPIDPADPASVVSYGAPLPIVLVMHGNLPNHQDAPRWPYDCEPPSMIPPGAIIYDDHHLGFTGLLDELARAGFIAVSIDRWDIMCQRRMRIPGAELFLEHLRWWADLNDGTASYDPFGGAFAGRVDLAQTVLAAHSIANEHISPAVQMSDVPGAAFPTAVFIAPVDPRSGDGFSGPALILVGSADSDTTQFNAHRWFDEGFLPGTTSELMVHGGTHNGWGAWGMFSGPFSGSPAVDPADQAEMTPVLVRRWLEWQLFGQESHRSIFTGDGTVRGLFDRSAGCSQCAVYHSFKEPGVDLTVDDFDNNDPSTGSWGQLVSQTGFDTSWWEGLWANHDYAYWYEGFGTSILMGHHARLLVADQPLGASGASFVQSEFANPLNASAYGYLHFRVGSLDYDVELLVALDGGPAEAVSTLGVTRIPYQPHGRVDWLRGTTMRSVRVPVACLAAQNPELQLSDLSTIYVQSASSGGFVMDDLSFQR